MKNKHRLNRMKKDEPPSKTKSTARTPESFPKIVTFPSGWDYAGMMDTKRSKSDKEKNESSYFWPKTTDAWV
jgi:hypothetical protein